MTWPAGSIITTNLDAGSDSPANARVELLSSVQQLNAVIASRGAADGVASLDSSTKIPRAQLPVLTVANGIVAWQAAGTYNWTVPAGVTRLYVECWGAGGGGGYGVNPTNHGGGGGAGGCSIKVWSVTPGDSVTIVVGAAVTGGVGPSNANASNGAASTVTIGGVSITGAGGVGGLGGTTGVGGSGAGGSGGDMAIAGGSGQTGIPGLGGIGGSGKTGSAPLPSGYGFGGGGYGSGEGGPSSGFNGADGGVLILY